VLKRFSGLLNRFSGGLVGWHEERFSFFSA